MSTADDKRNLYENETGTGTSELPSQPASYPRAPQYQHGTQYPYQQAYCYPNPACGTTTECAALRPRSGDGGPVRRAE